MTAAHWLLEETPVANEGRWEGSGWAEGPWANRGIVSQAESGTLWATMRPGSFRPEAESTLPLVSFPASWLVGWSLPTHWPLPHMPPSILVHHFGSKYQHDPPAALRIKAGFLTKQLVATLLVV